MLGNICYDALNHLISYCDNASILKLRLTNKYLYALASEENLWEKKLYSCITNDWVYISFLYDTFRAKLTCEQPPTSNEAVDILQWLNKIENIPQQGAMFHFFYLHSKIGIELENPNDAASKKRKLDEEASPVAKKVGGLVIPKFVRRASRDETTGFFRLAFLALKDILNVLRSSASDPPTTAASPTYYKPFKTQSLYDRLSPLKYSCKDEMEKIVNFIIERMCIERFQTLQLATRSLSEELLLVSTNVKHCNASFQWWELFTQTFCELSSWADRLDQCFIVLGLNIIEKTMTTFVNLILGKQYNQAKRIYSDLGRPHLTCTSAFETNFWVTERIHSVFRTSQVE